ncbi:unnamed protein product [Bursaphelenchus okinawaensis]|uniref:F-box domain-containing protein n=1 Tax=Bursaphelenchus okinawaensis TaxID=465554 RepID=A0A811KUI6_9BILA|nr:unnamed protein product [Bursaphelenchus okinawaensis]CAG9113473.1 unnamed protein product [Bursaphelenchus okinawaensis]
MKFFFHHLLPEIWENVIEHVTIMEDICSLAVVNKYFYKLVKTDFRQLCYYHAVYRLKGETWAYAFINFGNRAYNAVCGNKIYYLDHAICCPFTGRFAITLLFNYGCVLPTNIDFSLNQFSVLDFRSYTTQITYLNMINRGKELLVRSPYVTLVYDLSSMKVTHILTHNALNQYYAIQTGRVVDCYTKKEFQVDVKNSLFEIFYINSYGKCKYVGVHTIDDKLVVIDSETGEKHEVCEWRDKMVVYVTSENNSVVITGSRRHAQGCQIYCLRRRSFVFDQINDERWFLFNSSSLFKPADMSFLVYDTEINNWREIKPNPSLRLERRCECYLTSDFVPMPTYTIMESFQDGIVKRVLLRFKKGVVRATTFNAEVEFIPEKHNNWQPLEDDNHPIAQFLQMNDVKPSKKASSLIGWFSQSYMIEPRIQLVDAKTGAIKEGLNSIL